MLKEIRLKKDSSLALTTRPFHSKAYLSLWTYLVVYLVCTLALFWGDNSKRGIVLLFIFSLVFTVIILQHRAAKIQFIPIVILMIWLLSTVFLFEYGPYIYPVENKNLLYFYLVGVNLSLFIGYIKGTKARMLAHIRKYKVKEILNIFMLGSALYLLFNLPSFISSIPNILSVIQGNVATVRNAYFMMGVQWKDYISIFLYFFNSTFLILAIYYWESTSSFVHRFFIIDFILSFLFSMAIAGRSGAFSALVFITFSIIAAYFSGKMKKHVRKNLFVYLLLFAFLFLYLNFISSARIPSGSFETQGALPIGKLKEDIILFRIIPEYIYPLVFSGIQYISHGYYGLSLCLEKPFIGIAFGTGQSIFLARNYARYLNLYGIYSMSYPYRLEIEDNISYLFADITAYPGIASDVTFIGSIFVLFISGYLLALAWKDVLVKHNPFAVVAFVTLSSTIIFLPMHSVIQDGPGFVNFCSVILLWWFTRNSLVHKRVLRKGVRFQGENVL